MLSHLKNIGYPIGTTHSMHGHMDSGPFIWCMLSTIMIITVKILTMFLMAWYFFSNRCKSLICWLFESETCFEVISENEISSNISAFCILCTLSLKSKLLLLFLPYIQNRQENTSVLLCFELLKNSCVSHRKRGEVESIWWNMHLCDVDHPRRFFFCVLTVGTKWDKWKWNMHLYNVEHPRWFFFCVVGASPRPLDVHFYLKLSFILGKCWWQIYSRWNLFPFL